MRRVLRRAGLILVALAAIASLGVGCSSGGYGGSNSSSGSTVTNDAAVCDALLADPPDSSHVQQLASTITNVELRSVAQKGGLTGPGVSADDIRQVHSICGR